MMYHDRQRAPSLRHEHVTLHTHTLSFSLPLSTGLYIYIYIYIYYRVATAEGKEDSSPASSPTGPIWDQTG